MNINKIQAIADIVDAFRIIPRILIIAYCIWLGVIVNWFINIETVQIKKCDHEILKILSDKDVPLNQVENIACRVTSTAGGPTNQHVTFVSILTGIAPAMFGLYLNPRVRRKLKREKGEAENVTGGE